MSDLLRRQIIDLSVTPNSRLLVYDQGPEHYHRQQSGTFLPVVSSLQKSSVICIAFRV